MPRTDASFNISANTSKANRSLDNFAKRSKSAGTAAAGAAGAMSAMEVALSDIGTKGKKGVETLSDMSRNLKGTAEQKKIRTNELLAASFNLVKISIGHMTEMMDKEIDMIGHERNALGSKIAVMDDYAKTMGRMVAAVIQFREAGKGVRGLNLGEISARGSQGSRLEQNLEKSKQLHTAMARLDTKFRKLAERMSNTNADVSNLKKKIREGITEQVKIIPIRFEADLQFGGYTPGSLTARMVADLVRKRVSVKQDPDGRAFVDVPINVRIQINDTTARLVGGAKNKMEKAVQNIQGLKQKINDAMLMPLGVGKLMIEPKGVAMPGFDTVSAAKKWIELQAVDKFEIALNKTFTTKKRIKLKIKRIQFEFGNLVDDFERAWERNVNSLIKDIQDRERTHGTKFEKLIKVNFNLTWRGKKLNKRDTKKWITDEIEKAIPGRDVGRSKKEMVNFLTKTIQIKPALEDLDELQIKAMDTSAKLMNAQAKLMNAQNKGTKTVRNHTKAHRELNEELSVNRQRINNLAGHFAKMRRNLGVIRNQILLLTFAFAGLIRGIQETIRSSIEMESALIGLSSVARNTGNSMEGAQNSARDLASKGLIPVKQASEGLRNLLSAGFGLEQSIDLMNSLGDAAAFNRQGTLAYGQAVVGATQGIKNQNSIMVDNAGITKNLSIMYREYAAEIRKTERSLSEAEKRQAIYNGVMKEAAIFQGDSNKLLETTQGLMSQLGVSMFELSATLGDQFKPVLSVIVDDFINMTTAIKDWISENREFIRQDLVGLFKNLFDIVRALAGPMALIAEGLAKFAFLFAPLGKLVLSFSLLFIGIKKILQVVKAAAIGVKMLGDSWQFTDKTVRQARNSADAYTTVIKKGTRANQQATEQWKKSEATLDRWNKRNKEAVTRQRELITQIRGMRAESQKTATVFETVAAGVGKYNRAVDKANRSTRTFGGVVKTTGSMLTSFTGVVGIVTTALLALDQAMSFLKDSAAADYENTIAGINTHLEVMDGQLKVVAGRFDEAKQGIKDNSEESKKAAAATAAVIIEYDALKKRRLETEFRKINMEMINHAKGMGLVAGEWGKWGVALDAIGLDIIGKVMSGINDKGTKALIGGLLQATDATSSFNSRIVSVVQTLQALIPRQQQMLATLHPASEEYDVLNAKIKANQKALGFLDPIAKNIQKWQDLRNELAKYSNLTARNMFNIKQMNETVAKSTGEIFKLDVQLKTVDGNMSVIPASLLALKDGAFLTKQQIAELTVELQKLAKQGITIGALKPEAIPEGIIADNFAKALALVKKDKKVIDQLDGIIDPKVNAKIMRDRATQTVEAYSQAVADAASNKASGVGAFMTEVLGLDINEIKKQAALVAEAAIVQKEIAAQKGLRAEKTLINNRNALIAEANRKSIMDDARERARIGNQAYRDQVTFRARLDNVASEERLAARKGITSDLKLVAETQAELEGTAYLKELQATEGGRIRIKRKFADEAIIDETNKRIQFDADLVTSAERRAAAEATADQRLQTLINNQRTKARQARFNADINYLNSLSIETTSHEVAMAEIRLRISEATNSKELEAYKAFLEKRKKETLDNEKATLLGKEMLAVRTLFDPNPQDRVDSLKGELEQTQGDIAQNPQAVKQNLAQIQEALRNSRQQDLEDLDLSNEQKTELNTAYVETNLQLIGLQSKATEVAIRGATKGWMESWKLLGKHSDKFFTGQIKAQKALGVVAVKVAAESAAAGLDALSKFAKGKAKDNAAAALEHLAKGLAGSPGAFAAAAQFGAAAAAYGALAGVASGLAGKVRSAGDQAAENLLAIPGEDELESESEGRRSRRFGSSIQAQNINVTIAPHTTITGDNIFLSDGSVSELETNVSQMAVNAIQGAIENQEIDLAPAIQQGGN